jgi:hypothetical protein
MTTQPKSDRDLKLAANWYFDVEQSLVEEMGTAALAGHYPRLNQCKKWQEFTDVRADLFRELRKWLGRNP